MLISTSTASREDVANLTGFQTGTVCWNLCFQWKALLFSWTSSLVFDIQHISWSLFCEIRIFMPKKWTTSGKSKNKLDTFSQLQKSQTFESLNVPSINIIRGKDKGSANLKFREIAGWLTSLSSIFIFYCKREIRWVWFCTQCYLNQLPFLVRTKWHIFQY